MLAGAGDADRVSRQPWLPLVLFGKVLADAAGGIYLTLEQGTRHRRYFSVAVRQDGRRVRFFRSVEATIDGLARPVESYEPLAGVRKDTA